MAKYQDSNGTHIDELVCLQYPQGHSFTGEAMLELMPHGSPLILQLILEDLVNRGCRLAEPGEFTRRAFLNGKLDLTQAESIVEVINARSKAGLAAAQRQLSGEVGRTIDAFVMRLLGVSAHLEAYIDFPEEDLPPEDQAGPAQELAALIDEMQRLEATSHYKQLLQDGVRTVILGEPNAGKSSLLNRILGEERAIVSDIPGTTRDYLEASLMIGPFLLRVVDTAGIHQTADAIEQQGVERALDQVNRADLLLLIVDASRPMPELPTAVRDALRNKPAAVVFNKIDVASTPASLPELADLPQIRVSAKTGQGMNDLMFHVEQLLREQVVMPQEDTVLVSARHATALAKARESLEKAREKLRKDVETELVAVDIREAIDAMGEIVGRIDNEAMLDALFAKFCIGK